MRFKPSCSHNQYFLEEKMQATQEKEKTTDPGLAGFRPRPHPSGIIRSRHDLYRAQSGIHLSTGQRCA